MSTPNVPFKTPLGHDELRTRTHRLSQRHRTILLLVDGRRPLAEVLGLAQQAGSSISHFEDVLRMGLVELPIDVVAPDPVMTEPGSLATLRTTAVEVDVPPDTVSRFDAEPAVEDALPMLTVRTAGAADLAARRVITDDAAMLPAALMVSHDPSAANGCAEPPSEPVSELASEPASEPASELASEPVSEPASEPASEPVSEPVSELAAEAELPPEPLSRPVAEPPPEPRTELKSEPEPEPEPVAQVTALPSAPALAAPPVLLEASVVAMPASREPEAHRPTAAVSDAVAAPERAAFPPPSRHPEPVPAAPRRRDERPTSRPAPGRPEPVTLSELANVPAPDFAPSPVVRAEDAMIEQVRELLSQTVRQNPPPFVSRVPGRVSAARTLQDLRDLVLDIERYLSARRPRAGVAALQQARDLLGLGNTVVSEDSRSWSDTDDEDGLDVFRTTR